MIDCGVTTDDFYRGTLLPLSLYGFGSVDSLLRLKKYELEELLLMAQEREVQDKILLMHGYNIK